MQLLVENDMGLDAIQGWNIPIRKTIYGNEGDNILSGDNAISEYIFGWGGNDTIYGGPSDYLSGGTGNDLLIGGMGSNQFSAGAGFDTIVINHLDLTYRNDISEFHAAQDKIHLNSASFKGLDKGVLSANLFYIGEKGTGNWQPGAEDRLLYDKTQLTLDFRTETGALVRLAKMPLEFNSPDLSHANFFII